LLDIKVASGTAIGGIFIVATPVSILSIYHLFMNVGIYCIALHNLEMCDMAMVGDVGEGGGGGVGGKGGSQVGVGGRHQVESLAKHAELPAPLIPFPSV